MRKLVLLGVVLALGYSQRAQASLLINISANAASASCDNSTAAGVTACTTAGFTTLLGSNTISFGPGFSVGGYNFTGASGVTSNVPGDPLFSNLSDSKLSITHTDGAGDLTISFNATGYTSPTGPNMILSASSTGNWNVAAAGDNATFQAWSHADNSTAILPGTATTIAPQCYSGGPGTTLSCSTASPDVAWLRLGTPFSLSGREIIHQAIGSVASYQATINSTASAVPEPVTSSLVGLSLLGLGLLRRFQAGNK
jgi:hypothetical protein